MRQASRRFTGLFFILLLSPAGQAQVLHDHDNSPFTTIFGLPDSTEGGVLLDAGESAWGLLGLTASHSVSDATAGEIFVVDGETSRLELSYRRGIGTRWEFGVELPYVTHQSGGLDSVIEDWHRFFGFPDGPRDDRERDLLEFLYVDENILLADFRDNTDGIGDVRLFGGYQLRETERHRSALRLGIKFPTGDEDRLLGSGGTDVSVGLAGDWQNLGDRMNLSAFYRLNLTYIGEPAFLSDRYRELVGQASAGVRWRVVPAIGLTVQANVRSPLYDAEVEMLGETSVALTFGGDIQLSERFRLLIGVGEDIKVGSTPDVSFQLALHYQPSQGPR